MEQEKQLQQFMEQFTWTCLGVKPYNQHDKVEDEEGRWGAQLLAEEGKKGTDKDKVTKTFSQFSELFKCMLLLLCIIQWRFFENNSSPRKEQRQKILG
jgi:hypothetical protein